MTSGALELGIATAVALIASPATRALGLRFGLLDFPSPGLKPHPHPVSYLGGLAVAAGLAAGLAVRGWPLPWVATVAVFGMGAVGLADNVLGLPPALRFGLQLGVGVLLASEGLRPTLGPVALEWVLAVGLVAGAVNAVNMVDGMDGLAGTIAVLSAVGLTVIAADADRSAVLPLALAGATLGFLVFNLPPARLFLGNSGSYLLGAGLVVVVLALSGSAARFVGAGTCLGLFALDLLVSVLRRLVGRTPLFEPDRAHVYDQLLARGLSVVGCLVACAAIHVALVAVGVLAATLQTTGAVILVGAVWAITLAVLTATGFVTREVG